MTVVGSFCGPANFVSSSDSNTAVLDPGATWTYTCTVTPDNTTAKTVTFVDNATANGVSAVSPPTTPAPVEHAKAKVKVKAGPGPCGISVAVSPNPLVETGQSEVHAVVQVEACAAFAGDKVNIASPQLAASCAAGIAFGTLQPGAHRPPRSRWSWTTTATPRSASTASTAPRGRASSSPTSPRPPI